MKYKEVLDTLLHKSVTGHPKNNNNIYRFSNDIIFSQNNKYYYF